MNERYLEAPRLAFDCERLSRDQTVPAGAAIDRVGGAVRPADPGTGHDDPRRLATLVVEAARALSAPRAPCAIVCIEPPERSPAGPWLGLLAAGPDLFGMAEPDGHALLAVMAAALVAACPGARALEPVEGVADLTVTLATEAGGLVTFAPLLVTDRDALARLETDVRPDAAIPTRVLRPRVG